MQENLPDIPIVKISEVFETLADNEDIPAVLVEGVRSFYRYERWGEGRVRAVEDIPKDGYFLFEVEGNYLDKRRVITNRFLAKTKTEAKKRYKQVYGWNATKARLIPPGKEAKELLSTPFSMPL